MEDLTSGWSDEVKGYATEYGNKKAKLWSFEVKCKISKSTVRDTFFQAVSNSSWANFGCIGFILLDKGNPPESQVIIPAKERQDLDWDSINRLVTVNKSFVKYISGLGLV